MKNLLAARIVYCRFKERKGFVKVKENQAYSIRGYFIPAQGAGYQFMTYNPIRQVYEITSVSSLLTINPLLQLTFFYSSNRRLSPWFPLHRKFLSTQKISAVFMQIKLKFWMPTT